MRRALITGLFPVLLSAPLSAQRAAPDSSLTLLTPDRVFDGVAVHSGWSVLVQGSRILRAGPAAEISAPSEAKRIPLSGMTLLPGLIEGHSHLLLHPYNETV